MSIIAWDGKVLAADKRACMGTLIRTTTKIFKVNGCLVGYAGDAAFGEELLAWFKDGEQVDKFPVGQRDRDDWAGMLVIRTDKTIQKYERTPHPLTFNDADGLFVIGSGRDFAIAAMKCGLNAVEAVALTCELDNGCGNGIDSLTLDTTYLQRKLRGDNEEQTRDM